MLWQKTHLRQARGELNKNHNETDREGYTGFMPAHAGSELCPVAAFKNYVSHLNPIVHEPDPQILVISTILGE